MRWWVILPILVLLALAGCTVDSEPIDAVGCWVSDQSSSYYFELYDDGSCIMFDDDDNWVSAGTYRADTDQILFDMDTGSFYWSKNKNGMVFETTNGTITYHLQNTNDSK